MCYFCTFEFFKSRFIPRNSQLFFPVLNTRWFWILQMKDISWFKVIFMIVKLEHIRWYSVMQHFLIILTLSLTKTRNIFKSPTRTQYSRISRYLWNVIVDSIYTSLPKFLVIILLPSLVFHFQNALELLLTFYRS